MHLPTCRHMTALCICHKHYIILMWQFTRYVIPLCLAISVSALQCFDLLISLMDR